MSRSLELRQRPAVAGRPLRRRLERRCAAFRRTQQPEAHNQLERVIAQGDLVLMHVHVTTSAADRNNERAGVGIVDIFRVDGAKIVEHWDVVQPVPPTSVNSHTMFDGGARGHFLPDARL